MNLRIDKHSGVPIHDQLKEQIINLIYAGQLKTGDQLPTIRALSIELAVNFNTVALAYRELDMEGVIATRRGRGTFVARAPDASEMERVRREKLNELVARFFDETGRLGYSPEETRQALREHPSAQAP